MNDDPKQMSPKTVLNKIFDHYEINIHQHIITGMGIRDGKETHIVGTDENTSFGVDESLAMSAYLLNILEKKDKPPIFLMVDVAGQKLELRDEWLGMYGYFAHILKCLHLLRQQGNGIVSLIYNQAIGGSFIAFGMMADKIFALPHAKLAVMWLEGMAKVTKIDINELRKISETSPVFAPGVENFKQLGGLHEVVDLNHMSKKLTQVFEEVSISGDERAKLGKQLGGRKLAFDIIQQLEGL